MLFCLFSQLFLSDFNLKDTSLNFNDRVSCPSELTCPFFLKKDKWCIQLFLAGVLLEFFCFFGELGVLGWGVVGFFLNVSYISFTVSVNIVLFLQNQQEEKERNCCGIFFKATMLSIYSKWRDFFPMLHPVLPSWPSEIWFFTDVLSNLSPNQCLQLLCFS